MILNRLVECRRDDLAIDRAAHVRHLFRSLADETDHQVHVWAIRGNAVGDRLEQQRLASLGRRDDQAALPLPDRRDNVQQPGGKHVGLGFEFDSLQGKDRRQRVERRTSPRRLGINPIDRLDPEQAEELLVVLGWSHLTAHPVASSQAESSNLRLRHVDIVGTRQEPGTPQEAKPVLYDLEHSITELVPRSFSLGLQQFCDKIRPAHPHVAGYLELPSLLPQILVALLIEIANRQSVRNVGSVANFPLRFPGLRLVLILFPRTPVLASPTPVGCAV